MWRLFTLISALSLAGSWECSGDFAEVNVAPSEGRHLLPRSPTKSPIRILFYPISFNLGSPSLNDNFMQFILPRASDYFENFLDVHPVQGQIRLAVTSCLDLAVPSSHRTTGVSGYDLLVYISSRNMTTQPAPAIAGACYLDTGLNNVLAGAMIINTNVYNDTLTIGEKFSVVIHQLTHILGFSSALFPFWKDVNGLPHTQVTTIYPLAGTNKTVLITPNVLKTIQSILGCPGVPGMELEDYGDSHSIGNHWDKRVLINEYMVNLIVSDPIYSNLTAALLLDTGWYYMNPLRLNKPQVPYFERIADCIYVRAPCIMNGQAMNPIWCTDKSSYKCDYMNVAKGACNLNSNIPVIPTPYQYFSNIHEGGSDPYADYCPYIAAYPGASCRGPSKYTRSLTSEVNGGSSRCFNSTIVQSNGWMSAPYSACYEVKYCTAKGTYINIGEHIGYCKIGGTISGVPGYKGILTCPSNTVICNDNIPCKNGCFGVGRCSRGECRCLCGWSGDDCSITCTPNCKICDQYSCILCMNGYHLDAGKCVKRSTIYGCRNEGLICNSCYDGFYLNRRVCYDCPKSCLTCVSSKICTSCHPNHRLFINTCIPICPIDCLACSTPTNCLSCKSGFYLSAGFCVVCPNGCETCLDNDICLTCLSGWGMVNNMCKILTGNNCVDFISGNCTSCADGYFLANQISFSGSAISVCTFCDWGYKNCGSIRRRACFPGSYSRMFRPGFYGSSLSRACYPTPCNSFCTNCVQDLCLECARGYYLAEECKPCPVGCDKCFNSTYCVVCSDKYYLNYDFHNCSSCSGRTDLCSTPNCCGGCSSGFIMLQGICQPDCTKSNTDANSVSNDLYYNSHSCAFGYYLQYEECYPCPKGSLACYSATNCTVCAPGYVLNNGLCTLPSTCSVYCAACDGGSCGQCNDGYYQQDGACYSCANGCLICSSIEECDLCAAGYYLETSTCMACPTGCKDCDSSEICNACENGYVFVSGVCSLP